MSLYQAFAVLWHLDRCDIDAAQIVASMPPEFFAGFDRMLEAAFVAGLASRLKD